MAANRDDMKVVPWDIGEVTPYKNNPRKITPDAIAAVARSLETYGWRQPIVVDSEGVIVVGHTRFEAAKKLQMRQVPVHVMEGTEAEIRSYRLADNKLGELTDWHREMLSEELRDLDALGDMDMSDFGFTDEEIAVALGGLDDGADDVAKANGAAGSGDIGGTAAPNRREFVPHCKLFFNSVAAREAFMEWIGGQNANIRKLGDSETWVAQMPPK